MLGSQQVYLHLRQNRMIQDCVNSADALIAELEKENDD